MKKETLAALIIGARIMSAREFRAVMARIGYVNFLPAPLYVEQINELADAVMVAEKDSYVVVDLLPKEQQEPLKKWLVGQTLPVPKEANGALCCFRYDYDHWFSSWSNGKIAHVLD